MPNLFPQLFQLCVCIVVEQSTRSGNVEWYLLVHYTSYHIQHLVVISYYVNPLIVDQLSLLGLGVTVAVLP